MAQAVDKLPPTINWNQDTNELETLSSEAKAHNSTYLESRKLKKGIKYLVVYTGTETTKDNSVVTFFAEKHIDNNFIYKQQGKTKSTTVDTFLSRALSKELTGKDPLEILNCFAKFITDGVAKLKIEIEEVTYL